MTASAVSHVAIKIDEDIKARVKRLAQARRRTPHWLMREAITQYVDREEKREAFRLDSQLAWEAFRANGLHVSADEQMPGWQSSNKAMTLSHLNVTPDQQFVSVLAISHQKEVGF